MVIFEGYLNLTFFIMKMVQEAIRSNGMAHSEHVLSECVKNFCSRLQQLPVIIRPGESGVVAGVLTRSEFET